jgi:ABC-type tungstate transport system substrate-binding protein
MADISNLLNLFGTIFNILSGIAGAISLVFLVGGALQYSASGLDVRQSSEAKRTMLNALIGLGIVLVAVFVVQAILTAMGSRIQLPTNIGN